MTTSSYASDAKIIEALAILGADFIGQTEQTLLQQLVVAAALGGGGGGGASAWGSITGTLSAQTDLQDALDAKLNLAGGTLTGLLNLAGSANTSVLTSSGFSNTGADVTNMISLAGTWNTSGTTPTAIKLDMTHTSATDPRWFQFSRSGTAALWAGIVSSLFGNTNAPTWQGGTNGTQSVLIFNNNCVYAGRADSGWGLGTSYNFTTLPNDAILGFTGGSASAGNVPTVASQVTSFFAYGGAAASIQMGANHATTATHQTFKAHDVTTGAGADLILQGGAGSANDGYVKIGTATGGLAFLGAAGAPLISGNTNTNISSAGAGSALLDDTQSDGGLAGGSYTFGGLVAALKSYGIIG